MIDLGPKGQSVPTLADQPVGYKPLEFHKRSNQIEIPTQGPSSDRHFETDQDSLGGIEDLVLRVVLKAGLDFAAEDPLCGVLGTSSRSESHQLIQGKIAESVIDIVNLDSL